MVKQAMIAMGVIALAGCSTAFLDQMNSGLNQAMGQPISKVESALGPSAQVSQDGDRTKYRWFTESSIQPCDVQVWTDADGLIRKTQWSGYTEACREFANGLTRVFP